MLYADAHQMHAAVDLGCNESAQLMYELLLRVLAGYRPFLRSWEGDFHQLTRVWTTHGVGNSESMDARAFVRSNIFPTKIPRVPGGTHFGLEDRGGRAHPPYT